MAAAAYASSGASDFASCSFADNGSYTVSGRIINKDDGAAEFTTVVMVDNVAPTVSASGNASTILQGEAFSGSGSVNYGDGSPAESLTLAGNAFTFSHVYTTAGNYTVNITISDDDGASGSTAVDVLVNAPVSVSSPQEKTRMIIDKIKTLISTGAVSGGNGNALASKLDGAIQAFDKGNPNAAINTLNSFINQVNALVKSGKLTQTDGQALISAAQAVINGK